MKTKRIILTGGGSSGHVTPNLALIPKLREKGYDIQYIGSDKGIEKEVVGSADLPFHGIPAGKLRRYFSWQNFTDVFRIMNATVQAFFLLRKLRPQVVFSKGGFVSCPVVWGAWLNRIPVVIHESDITPGLANRLSKPFASTICLTFPESVQHIGSAKTAVTGLPLRDFLMKGNAEAGRTFCDFDAQKPVLLIIGGSQGAQKINETIRAALPSLTSKYQIVHLCGKGKVDQELLKVKGYRQYEYINQELPDLFAMTHIVISRAGSTSINEIKQLKKLNLLIPLSKRSSRGDQILNAHSFEQQGISAVLLEESLTVETMLTALSDLEAKSEAYRKQMNQLSTVDSIDLVINAIEEAAKSPS